MAQHRLQRLAAPSRSFSLALHAAAIASIAYSFNFLLGWENFISESYGWHFQFLTILALSVTLLTFVLALLADLTLSPALFAAKNAVALIAAPVETVVSILYWSLQFYDPALLAPDGFELDLHIDLGFHMAPTVFLIVDLLLLSPPWTIPTYGMMGISTAAAFGYWYWVEQCFAHNGWYPYPLFALLSTSQRVAFFFFAAALATACASLLRLAYAVINGYDSVEELDATIEKKQL